MPAKDRVIPAKPLSRRDLPAASRRKIVAVGAYWIAGGVAAFFVAQLWSVAGGSGAAANSTNNSGPVASYTVERLGKGDRLSIASFDARWSAIGPTRQFTPAAAKRVSKIPFGCEGAFSVTLKIGNFSTRCLAAIEGAPRLAALD